GEVSRAAAGAGRMAAFIDVESVSKRYQTRSRQLVTALEGVSLDVHADEFLTIVGPSGCGKSTLLKLIGGLLPPTAGTTRLRRKPLDGPTPAVRMVLQ